MPRPEQRADQVLSATSAKPRARSRGHGTCRRSPRGQKHRHPLTHRLTQEEQHHSARGQRDWRGRCSHRQRGRVSLPRSSPEQPAHPSRGAGPQLRKACLCTAGGTAPGRHPAWALRALSVGHRHQHHNDLRKLPPKKGNGPHPENHRTARWVPKGSQTVLFRAEGPARAFSRNKPSRRLSFSRRGLVRLTGTSIPSRGLEPHRGARSELPEVLGPQPHHSPTRYQVPTRQRAHPRPTTLSSPRLSPLQ